MIKFFRDVLDGPLYIVLLIVSIILIMAIIGFILERKQKLEEKENQFAHVDSTVSNVNHSDMITPVNKVDIDTNAVNNNVVGNENTMPVTPENNNPNM